MFVFAIQSTGLAAVSSSKAKPSAPTRSTTTQKAAPSTQKPDSSYKPSAPASSYSEKAPATKPNQASTANPSATATTSGSFMRNAAMIGGGMLLGSMLGNLFGFGANGAFAEIVGFLFNLLLLAGIGYGGLYLWRRFKQNKQDDNRRNQQDDNKRNQN